MADEFQKYPEETPETKTTIKTGILKIDKLRNPLLTKMNPISEYDYRNLPGLMQGCKIATFQQSARCPVVKQPNLAALTPKSWAGDANMLNRV